MRQNVCLRRHPAAFGCEYMVCKAGAQAACDRVWACVCECVGYAKSRRRVAITITYYDYC